MSLAQILFSFHGRIPRGVFWVILGIAIVLSFLVGACCLAVCQPGRVMYAVAASIHVLWSLVLSWVLLAVQVKRCHDMGRSGWMVLVGLIPLLGSIVLLAILGFVKGDSGYNVYGADPLRTWMRK